MSPSTELSELNFSGIDASDVLARVARKVEVQDSSSGIGAACEDAAVMYANGDSVEAEKVLAEVIDNPGMIAGDGMWLMLLDLYRLTGQRQRFEAKVQEYASRLRRPLRPWVDLSLPAALRPAKPVPVINLAGKLSAKAAGPFQQILDIGLKSGALQIDCGRLSGADEVGCALFRQTLTQLAADRVQVTLLNFQPLLEALGTQITAGGAQVRDAWLLMFEVLLQIGDRTRFDTLARSYAMLFDEAPPLWSDRLQQFARELAGSNETAHVDGDLFRFDGDLVGATNDALRKLAAFGSERQDVIVDCADLRRIDFVCAGMLFNILSTLRAQGRHIALQNVNAMVGALLRVMGVDQVAYVTLRP